MITEPDQIPKRSVGLRETGIHSGGSGRRRDWSVGPMMSEGENQEVQVGLLLQFMCV